jgi:hypothetical protein
MRRSRFGAFDSAGLSDQPARVRARGRFAAIIVLVTVTSMRLLLGGACVVLAVPLAAIVTTMVELTLLDRDPRDQEAPTVLGRPKGGEDVTGVRAVERARRLPDQAVDAYLEALRVALS